MSEINLRIQNKHDTIAAWKKVENTFIPYAGEIIIYDDYITRTDLASGATSYMPGLRIGNGISYLKDLQFISSLDSEFEDLVNNHINNKEIHVSAGDRIVWDSNITYRMDSTAETLSLLNRTEREVK